MYLKLHQAKSDKDDDMSNNTPMKQNTVPAAPTKPVTPAPVASDSIITDYFTRVNN
jgi:hypothetical protein